MNNQDLNNLKEHINNIIQQRINNLITESVINLLKEEIDTIATLTVLEIHPKLQSELRALIKDTQIAQLLNEKYTNQSSNNNSISKRKKYTDE